MKSVEETDLFFDLLDPYGENEAQLEKLKLKEGERREVAILFADVKGSTALGSRLDPEAFNQTLDPLMKRFSRCITYYGGYVDKYMGDGIMALFGARQASEQDTERAVMAALKMITQLDWINRKLAIEGSGKMPKLDIRIGINTGLVVVGKVGEEREGDFTVIGSAVNLAQRMEANAPINSILMPVHTMKTVERFFEFKRHSDVIAKGFEQPVESYIVLNPRQERGQRWYRQKTEFIGRDKEFKTLTKALDKIESFCQDAATQQPEPFVIGIMGDAGLGKTRLVHEFHLANNARMNIFNAASSALVRTPLHLFTDLLTREFRIAPADNPPISKNKLEKGIELLAAELDQDSAKELTDALPLIGALLEIPYPDPRLKLSGTELLAHLKLAMRAVIQAIFKVKAKNGKPIVLVLDDIHWIDDVSASLMKYLLEKLVCDHASELYGRVMAILLYREEYHPALADLPQSAFAEIALKPLEPSEITQLLLQKSPGLELDQELLAKLQKLSMGNPFYLEEWCNYLDDITQQDLHDLTIPPNLHALVLSRLDVLEYSLRLLLQKAAVIGQQFFVDILNWIEDKLEYPMDLNETLEQLEQQAYVLRLLGFDYSAYFFKHITTRDVAYQTLLLENRSILHKLAAQAIEELYPQRRQEFLFVLADHYHRSGTADKAAFYLEQAAQTAAKMYNNKDAISLWEKLLDWLPQLHTESSISQAKIRLEICELKSLIGDWEGAKESLKLAHSAATTSGELFDYQRLCGILAFRQGEPESALEAWNAGLELAQSSTQYAIAHGNLGIWYQHHKDWEKAFTHHEKSLEYAEQAQDSLRTAKTLSNLALMSLEQKDYPKAEEYLQNSLELCEAHQYLQLKSIILGNLGWLRYRQKDLDAAMHFYERKWRLVDKIGDNAELIKVLGNMGNVYRDQRKHHKALEFYRKVLQLKQPLGNPLELAITHNAIAGELKELGELGLALEHITQSVALTAAQPQKQCEYLFYQAEIMAELEEHATALAIITQAIKMATETGRSSVETACLDLQNKIKHPSNGADK